jgi:hypothetical protein
MTPRPPMRTSPPPPLVQLTEKVVEAVPPAGTETVRGFAPPTAQFPATPLSATERSPDATPVKVTLPLAAIA